MHVVVLFTTEGVSCVFFLTKVRTCFCVHRLGQGHDNCICQAKELPFYPKPKVLPTAKVFQDWIG